MSARITQTYSEHGLHLDHGQVSVGVLQLLLVLLNLPFLTPVQVGRVPVGLLDLLKLLALLLYFGFELLVLFRAVH